MKIGKLINNLISLGLLAAGVYVIFHWQDFGTTKSDVEAFAEKLDLLAGDAGLRAKMGAAGREKALTFSWDAVLDELIANYYDAMATFHGNAKSSRQSADRTMPEAA